MLLDAEAVRAGDRAARRYDVCICGTGPAGIALALQLASRNLSVALMEGGATELTAQSQDCYRGSIVGADYAPLETTRLRFLGGTSNHWSGLVVPLHEADFKPNPANPLSGWPIRADALAPYFQPAIEFLSAKRIRGHDPLGLEGTPLFPYAPWESLPVARLGTSRRKQLEDSSRIDLYLDANLVDLELTENGAAIVSASFRTYAKPEPFAVSAGRYVLCLGGIENARLLLNCNRQMPHGIGNQNDQVGRYFQDQLHVMAGDMLYDMSKVAFLPHQTRFQRWAYYIPTEAFMREQECLDFVIYLDPPAADPGWSDALAESIVCSTDFMAELAKSVTGGAFECGAASQRVRIGIEPQLNPESRVLLGEEKDRFGLRRPALDWRHSEQDVRTLRAAINGLGRLVAEKDVARGRVADWLAGEGAVEFPSGMNGVCHHLCATRMSDDPKTGVVDADCKVHDIENLYIGGSSVFATPGYSNPTLTVVQLALRLGDHLAGA